MNNTDLAALYKEADLCLERNDLSSALLCYTELCKVDSENAEPWFMLGLVYGETGDLPQAKSCLYRAIELNPAHADAHLNLAHFLSSLDDVESALMHCEQAINHDFEYAEAWLLRSGLLAIQGKLEEALMAVNKALTLNTNLPTALLHAARIEYQLANYPQALDKCQLSLKQNPVDIASKNLLGSIFLRLQKMDDAEQIFNDILKTQADNIEALRGKAFVCLYNEQNAAAIDLYTRSLALDPACELSWVYLSRTYAIENIFDKAADCAKRAIELNPSNLDSHVLLANMLAIMGQFDDALFHLDITLSEAPQNMAARMDRAKLHQKMGQYEKSRHDLKPVFELPDIPLQAIIVFAELARDSDEVDIAISKLEAIIPESIGDELQQIHQYLGRLYEHKKLYDQAFSHYIQANRLRKNTYNPEAMEKLVNEIIVEYSDENLRVAPRSSKGLNSPIFIVGMMRSGTSLTEQIIASHSAVYGGGELQLLPQIAAALAENLAEGAERNLLRPPSMSKINVKRLNDATQSYIDQVSSLTKGVERITDKMLYNVFHLGLIALMFPQARIIHCVRDPMDVCLSNYFQNYSGYNGFATDLSHIGHFYRQFERLMRHWGTVLPLPILKVKYEDLVANQQNVTQGILEFCGLSWEDACLNFHKNTRLVNTASYNQIRQPMYSSSVTRWRQYEQYLEPLKKALSPMPVS